MGTSSDNYILLKDVQSNGKTIKSVVLPLPGYVSDVREIIFSPIDGHRAIYICFVHPLSTLKIWYPYAVDDDVDPGTSDSSLITILETQYLDQLCYRGFVLSRDNTMLALYDHTCTGQVMLYSINNDHQDNSSTITSTNKSKVTLTLKQSFSARHIDIDESLHFTPDNKYISYNNSIWDIKNERVITNRIISTYNDTDKSDWKMSTTFLKFSPAGNGAGHGHGRRLLVRRQKYSSSEDSPTRSYSIASFLGK